MKNCLSQVPITVAFAILFLSGSVFAQTDDTPGVFTVTEGASPWYDRAGQWSLTNVPDDLKGSGPLPQGACSGRSLDVPGQPASILIGVQVNDVAKFTAKFPAATDAGTQIAVKNPEGTTLPYTIFTLPNPPARIDGEGVFGAGLLLLKVANGRAVPGSSPSPAASTPKSR